MTEAEITLTSLSTTRSRVLDPPDELIELAAGHRLVRLVHADGRLGWIVLNYRDASRLLKDPRVSSRQDLRHGPLPHARVRRRMEPTPPGFFMRLDPPEHGRYRRHFAGLFGGRSMSRLESAVIHQVDVCLDRLAEAGPPADLAGEFAEPLASSVVCGMVGVPERDRTWLAATIATMLDLTETAERVVAAEGKFRRYLEDLAGLRRREPADDLMSMLTQRQGLTDAEVSNMMQLVLSGGLEITASMLSFGVFALLTRPDQLRRLLSKEVDDGAAVEELLRFLTVSPLLTRTVLDDIDVDGQRMRAGEPMTIHLGVVNRDRAQFGAADDLDLGRPSREHLAFGDGPHTCLGQHLARLLLRVGYRRLFDRFPGIRLAVPESEVATRNESVIYGVKSLPVIW
ncbi:cytochrome P450 [Streptosporangium sandarakinum]|uniref:cytochrome P450 n=1 Tax=Streptosporangium sandarakinum TaxID=1260955 RepID=UPI00343D910B